MSLFRIIIGILFLKISFFFSSSSWASSQSLLSGQTLVAQSDPDEAFDPFTDYSEFDESSDEEADINFFQNGRFFTFGLITGTRGFTDNFDKIYTSGPTFGLILSYFFDLRSGLAIGILTGDHDVEFSTNLDRYTGKVSITTINFDYKYYFNTQNVTRGLADLNPYMLVGFSQFYRTHNIDKVSSIAGISRDAVMGADVGAGLEIPLARKKAFLGLQAVYHYVTFQDENKIYFNDAEILKRKFSGDIFDLNIIIGMNF